MRSKRLLLAGFVLLFLAACGGTFEVNLEQTTPPDQSLTSRNVTPTPQQSVIPTSTPAAPLSGTPAAPPWEIVYRTGDGLWKVTTGGQSVQILDRASGLISPDGAYVLYQEHSMSNSNLWLADLTTGERRNLTRATNSTVTNFRWWPARPDVIILSSRPQEIEPGPGVTGFLAMVGVQGNSYRILDDQNHTGGLPALSPDGQTIAYGSGSTGWLYHWEAGPEATDKLHPFDPADYGLIGYYKNTITINSPSWSPDGTKLAWIVNGDFAMNNAQQMGIGIFDLETRTAQVLHPYEPMGGGGDANLAPAWSPDGQWLAFTAWASDSDESGVWVVSVDGQQETEYHLGQCSTPVWSPDGRMFACTSTPQGLASEVLLVEVGTWDLYSLDLPSDAYLVDWVNPSRN